MKVEGGIHGRKLKQVAACVAKLHRKRRPLPLQHDALRTAPPTALEGQYTLQFVKAEPEIRYR